MTLSSTTPVVPGARVSPDAGGSLKEQRRRAGAGSRRRGASPLTYVVLVVAMLLSFAPLYWTFVMASRTNDQVTAVPPPLTPGGELGANITRVFENQDVLFLRSLVNSFLVAGTVTVSTVFFCSLAGYAFAKLRFRGQNALLLVVILTMMVPIQLGVIPLYQLMDRFGLVGELPAVILPFLVSGFGVFMMRQYAAQAVPTELIEAARVDGCSTFRTFWNVVMPALRPAAAVLGLFTFMQQWNEFIWPYLILNNPEVATVQVALSRLSSGYYTDLSLVLAGTAVATIPLLVIFLVFGRQLIGGLMEGAVKA